MVSGKKTGSFLNSRRLELRRYLDRREDLDFFQDHMGNFKVNQYTQGALCREQSRELFYSRVIKNPMAFLIVLKESGVPIGHIFLKVEGEHSPEIGFSFNPEYWGQGLGYEALKIASEFYLKTFPEIFATVDLENKASTKLLGKCGFHKLGKRKDSQGFYLLYSLNKP